MRGGADSNCKTPEEKSGSLYRDVPFIGERESLIHSWWGQGVLCRHWIARLSKLSCRQPGMAASFRMSMSIRKPPPALLLERPPLGNFAEFA